MSAPSLEVGLATIMNHTEHDGPNLVFEKAWSIHKFGICIWGRQKGHAWVCYPRSYPGKDKNEFVIIKRHNNTLKRHCARVKKVKIFLIKSVLALLKIGTVVPLSK